MTNIPVDKLEYTRAGVKLRNVALDERALAREFGKIATFTVVSQSVHDGNTVLRGTVIDVTVAVTRDLPVAIIPDVPVKWQKFTIGDLADKVRNEPTILKLLGDHDSPDTFDEVERKEFTTFMERAGLGGSNEDVTAGFALALNAHTLAGEG